MGTPMFAVPTLHALRVAGHEIVAVVTAPDRPAGRGLQLKSSEVKQYAEAHQLPVLQPEKLRDPDFIAQLIALRPDLAVVVAFRMLPEAVWRIPARGTLNLHASLLPAYRGAAPINWAVANGEKQSGITTFLIDREIDTGAILLQETVEILPVWDAGDLHDVLMEKGARLVAETVRQMETGELRPVPQQLDNELPKAPKLNREHAHLNWSQNALEVHNLIRGMSPYPAAWTTLEGLLLKVYRSSLTGEATQATPGTLRITEKGMEAACADEWLQLLQVQLEGKKKMAVNEFLKGYRGSLERVGEG